jgi:hypothetical protein
VRPDELDGIETCYHQVVLVFLFDHFDCVLWM